MSDLSIFRSVSAASRPLCGILHHFLLTGFLVLPAHVTAAEPVTEHRGSMGAILILVLLLALTVSALTILGIVHWSRMQEHTRDMMRFCMKFMLHSDNEAERCASAKSLSRVNDPGAIPVLADVMWDEQEPEPVREAAGEALHQMSNRLRKHKRIISQLELELEKRNFRGIIEILIENFERGRTRYVQSAYLIGRQFMHLHQYMDAREWLRKADARNRKFNLYGNRIRLRIQECNAFLLAAADDAFKAGDYQRARERYAALDHGLNDAERQRYAIFLRSACVYCKLHDYRNADQSLLTALRYGHQADAALALVPLMQKILTPDGEHIRATDKREEITAQIGERASAIMEELMNRHGWQQTD